VRGVPDALGRAHAPAPVYAYLARRRDQSLSVNSRLSAIKPVNM
jgi:hypothetical protein